MPSLTRRAHLPFGEGVLWRRGCHSTHSPLWRRGQLAPGHAARLALRPRETAINSAIDRRACVSAPCGIARAACTARNKDAATSARHHGRRGILAWHPTLRLACARFLGHSCGMVTVTVIPRWVTNAICLPTQPWTSCPVTLLLQARQTTTTRNLAVTLDVQHSGPLASSNPLAAVLDRMASTRQYSLDSENPIVPVSLFAPRVFGVLTRTPLKRSGARNRSEGTTSAEEERAVGSSRRD
jgi:hypothetical protein